MQTRKKTTAKATAGDPEGAAIAAMAKDSAACLKVFEQYRQRFAAHQEALASAAKSAPVAATLRDSKGGVTNYTVAEWAADHAQELGEDLKTAIETLQRMPQDFAADLRRFVAEQQAEQDRWRIEREIDEFPAKLAALEVELAGKKLQLAALRELRDREKSAA